LLLKDEALRDVLSLCCAQKCLESEGMKRELRGKRGERMYACLSLFVLQAAFCVSLSLFLSLS
jgi:hypothetical protein